MGTCYQCEKQIGVDYHYNQEINLHKEKEFFADLDEQNLTGKQKLNVPEKINDQRKIKTYSRITTAASSQENQEFNNQLANSQDGPVKQKDIRPNYKQRSQMFNQKNYQQKISEEAESMLSQLDEKISKKNSKLNQKIDSEDSSKHSKNEPTLIDLLNKIDNKQEEYQFIKLANSEPDIFMLEEMDIVYENINDNSISEIQKENKNENELDFVHESDDSFWDQLEEENNLNKAFIYYDAQNNLSLSNICNSQTKVLFNARLTYNPSVPYQFSRQISSLSKINQSNPFLNEQSGVSRNSQNEQILINRMPTNSISQKRKRINYIKINYQ